MALWVGAQAATDPFDGAEWLRDPRFQGVPVINVMHREKDSKPDPAGPRNMHTLFRREVTLRDKPQSAVMVITGDDYYKFYINGFRVVQGPEPGYPNAYPYYLLEVAPFLEKGPNCLAAHAYYQGLINRVWNSGDGRSGFMLALDVTYADGTRERFVTDPSWRCVALSAYDGDKTVGYKTQFLEDIDMRKMPVGWQSVGFDAAAWTPPLLGRQDHYFTLQSTPPLQVYAVKPKQVKKLDKGHYFYDFGTEIVGCTRIRIQGSAGTVITVRHGEELSAPDTVRFDMRANCVYEERPILSGGKDVIEFYDYKAFRYMEILDAPEKPEVWVDVRHHPFDPGKCSFTSSDKNLEAIWSICRNGVQMGSQGGFLDCPTREKGQYLGDAVITSRSHLWLTADPTLTRKALVDFAHSQQIDPGMMAVAPGSFMQEICEYSLQYPLLLANYYRMTGDRAFTELIVDSTFDKLFGYFAAFENWSSLLEGISKKNEKWVLVDWPQELRDGFDYDYADGKANAVVNAFYYGALRTAAQLCRDLGRDGKAYDKHAAKVAAGFAAKLANADTGLYVDAPGSKHSSLHANAIPLYFGLTKGADKDKILALIREKRLSCGVYIAPYVIEACFQNGAADLGYDVLTSTDLHSWREMLKNGATTCMEAWGPDQKKNTSWCHAWSSSPIYLLAGDVMGLSPAEPGWKRIRIAPPVIKDLPEMYLRVPIPQGEIIVRHVPGKGYMAMIPEGIEADVPPIEGVPVQVEKRASLGKPVLTQALADQLARAGWAGRVGSGAGIFVSIPEQMFYLIENGVPVWQARCSTAAAGAGSREGSLQTPAGWHKIETKIGDGKPWGQVYESREAAKTIWQPGMEVKDDLVLTRVLPLDGLEAGVNQGKDAEGKVVDSRARGIYIHGTNGEDKIGTPASHGCIRLLNDDVIALFDRVAKGVPVYISDK